MFEDVKIRVSGIIRRHWPLITAIGVLYITVAVLLLFSTKQNQGHLVYTIDDTYIHMAVAKNFVLQGVWGVTRYSFSSSTSSLLWPLLLSLVYVLLGISELSPLIINVVLATLFIWLTYILLRREGLSPLLTFITGMAIIFFTSLPVMIFVGMEHILHALVTIGFVYLSAQILTHEKSTRLEFWLWLMLGAIVTASRYEGLFLILVVLALFIARKRYLYSFLLAIFAIAPLAIYGIISTLNGWYFLPNPVLLKSNMADLFYRFSKQMVEAYILIPVSLALVLFIVQFSKQKTVWRASMVMLIIFVATTILHMCFAGTGNFWRYESYLVALSMFVLAIAAHDYLHLKLTISFSRSLMPKYLAVALLICLIILPLVDRGFWPLKLIPQATTNIYEQQYQMGLFLEEYYQGEAVAANDVGAINYLADIRCLDLWGLSSLEIARAKQNGYYNTDTIYHLAREKRVKIAIVYDHWFKGNEAIPAQWIRVGQWTISNNVVCAGDTVSFYAAEPEAEDDLIKNLKNFSSRLPADVIESGKYTSE